MTRFDAIVERKQKLKLLWHMVFCTEN